MHSVKEGKNYINKKSGKPYFVFKLGIDVSTNLTTNVVLYYALTNPEVVYVRNLEEFQEKFEDPDDQYSLQEIISELTNANEKLRLARKILRDRVSQLMTQFRINYDDKTKTYKQHM